MKTNALVLCLTIMMCFVSPTVASLERGRRGHKIGACLHYRGGEGPELLIEWIEWHHLIGVSEFYIYEDAKSTEEERIETRETILYYTQSPSHQNSRKSLPPPTTITAPTSSSSSSSSSLMRRRTETTHVNQIKVMESTKSHHNRHVNHRHRMRDMALNNSRKSNGGAIGARPMVELNKQPPVIDEKRRRNGGAAMHETFEHCMATYAGRVDWLLFVDSDELVGIDAKYASLQDMLVQEPTLGRAPGILMRWKQYVASGGYESVDVVTRDPSVPMSASLRHRSRLQTGIKLMMRTDQQTIQDCKWPRFRHAHNCLCDAPTPERWAVAADTMQPSAEKWYIEANANTPYGPVWLNHYHTRSCHEYVHGVLARRHRNLIEDGHIKPTDTMDTLPRYHPARMRLDPTLCTRLSAANTIRDDQHSVRMFEPLAHNCQLHPLWPKRMALASYVYEQD